MTQRGQRNAGPRQAAKAIEVGALSKVDLGQLPANGAIHWGPANGPKLVVLSDFQCGYCRKLSAELVKTPEGKARLQAAVNEYWPYLPKFFGGSKSRNNEIFRKWKIKQRTNDEMREDYVKRATEVAAKYGLTLPKLAEAA